MSGFPIKIFAAWSGFWRYAVWGLKSVATSIASMHTIAPLKEHGPFEPDQVPLVDLHGQALRETDLRDPDTEFVGPELASQPDRSG